MNAFKVHYRLIVDDRSFTKVISVMWVPQVGNEIKAADNSFIVEHPPEQDLDAYDARDYENGQFCDSVLAHLNEKMYLPHDGEHPEVVEELLKHGWKERE